MLKSEERRIGDHLFRVTQVPGTKSIRLFTRITKLVGPAIGALAKDGEAIKSLLDQDVGQLGAALQTLCDDLNPDEIEALGKDFAKHARVKVGGEGEWMLLENEAVFDDVFAGGVDVFLGWLGFSLQVNYSSFLAAGRKLTGRGSGNDATG